MFVGKTGAEICLISIQQHGVNCIFGYPGGAILPLFDALYDSKTVTFVLSRHEQGAGHMAEGYARATGNPGVVLVTSGPGSTNIITPLYNAFMDGTPIVVISGQVEKALIGTQAFQEIDIVAMTQACTKWNVSVKDVHDLPSLVDHAFTMATSGRPGPVLIDIPKDILTSNFRVSTIPTDPMFSSPTYEVAATVQSWPCSLDMAFDHAVRLVDASSRPVILAGYGMVSCAQSHVILHQLMQKSNIPVVATLQGHGIADTADMRWLGMLGVYGTARANWAVQHADLILVLGARLDDRATGPLETFAPAARQAHTEHHGGLIRFDVDSSRLNSPIEAAVGIAGDISKMVPMLTEYIRTQGLRLDWRAQIEKWQQTSVLSDSKHITIENVVTTLSRIIAQRARRTVVTTGVGQHQMWTAHCFRWTGLQTLITSGGAGTMGFGLPAAIGAKIACPENDVVDIDGDASFAMSMTELMTAAETCTNVKVIIINNGEQRMITQLQTQHYGGRLAFSQQQNPDFRQLARSMGVASEHVDRREELEHKVLWLLQRNKPAILDVQIGLRQDTLPHVPSGRPLHELTQVN